MFASVFELSFTFAQYFATITDTPDFDVPSEWQWLANIFRFSAIAFSSFRDVLGPFQDVRVFFMTLCIALPLFFSFVGIVLLNPFRIILWYCTLLLGSSLTTAGAYTLIVGSTLTSINMTKPAAGALLCVGLFLLLLSLVAFLLRNALAACDPDVESKANTVEDRMGEETRSIRKGDSLFRALTCGLFAVVGAVCLGFLADELVVEYTTTDMRDYQILVGSVCAGIAGIIFVWFVVGLTHCGRVFQWKLANFLEHNFMRVLLLAMSIAYVPIGASVFSVFNCNDFTCDVGTRLVMDGSRMHTVAGRDFCTPCSLGTGSACPAMASAALCAGMQQSRLEADRRISCSSLQTFYWPAAGIVIVFYMIGVPVLFFSLISLATRLVEEDYPVDAPETVRADPAALWAVKVVSSDNAAKFFYQPFLPTMRFARLFFTVHKLFVVFMTVFIVRIDTVSPAYWSLGSALLLHTIGLGVIVLKRPFIAAFENGLALVMQLMLIVTTVCALLVHVDSVAVPGAVLLILAVVNITIAAVALVVGLVLECWVRRRQSREAEEDRRQRLETEVREREDAAQQAEEQAQLAPVAGIVVPVDVQAQARAEAELAAQIAMIEAALQPTLSGQFQPQFQPHYPPQPQPSPPPQLLPPYPPQGPYMGVVPHPRSPPPAPVAPATNPLVMMVQGAEESPEPSTHGTVGNDSFASTHSGVTQATVVAPGATLPPGVSPKSESGRQRKERLRKVRADARRDLVRREEQLRQQLATAQADIDLRIDTAVKRTLSTFLMIFGVLGCTAMGFAVVGLFQAGENSPTAPADSVGQLSLASELVGYPTWVDFAGDCCCTYTTPASAATANATDQLVEQWLCGNGAVKERVRVRRTVDAAAMTYTDETGLGFRAACGATFRTGCALTTASDGTLVLQCADGSIGPQSPLQLRW